MTPKWGREAMPPPSPQLPNRDSFQTPCGGQNRGSSRTGLERQIRWGMHIHNPLHPPSLNSILWGLAAVNEDTRHHRFIQGHKAYLLPTPSGCFMVRRAHNPYLPVTKLPRIWIRKIMRVPRIHKLISFHIIPEPAAPGPLYERGSTLPRDKEMDIDAFPWLFLFRQ